MRVELVVDGGFAYFPALARPMVVDASSLSAADAADLRRKCDLAIAAAKTAGKLPQQPAPDARRYRISIDLDGRRHEIVAADPVESPALAELIDAIRERAGR